MGNLMSNSDGRLTSRKPGEAPELLDKRIQRIH
jgi:hypothetical protein